MPSIAWTYTTLLQALQDWPVNDNATYVANLPTMIGLGELRLVRDLDLEIFDQEDTSVSMTIGNRLALKPTNALIVRAVGFVDPTLGFQSLEQRSYDYCKLYAPLVVTQGTPQYWAHWSPTQIYLVDTPSAALPLHYHSVMRPTDLLSSSSPGVTSWLSTRVPDALFAACLMEGEHYMQADDRYEDYKNKYYQELLPAARFELRQLQRSGDYSPFNPAARSK